MFRFFKKKNPAKELPPEAERYLGHFSTRLPKATPLRQLRFVILDTETTGLDIKKDRILSVGAIAAKDYGLRVEDRLELFIKQDGYVPGAGISIHGITANRADIGTNEKEVILQVLEFLRDGILVGHHIGFDKGILDETCFRQFGFRLKNTTLDTATLEWRLHAPIRYNQSHEPPASLDSLCQKYFIDMGERHTAAGDAFITGLVFLKQLARLESRGVKTAGDLLK